MDFLSQDRTARLLRLKRYEQPPPSCFENFLHEFRRRRQRDESLREPLWSMCVDRVRDFVFLHNVRPLAWYSAGMAAAVACAAIISITVYQQPGTTTKLAVQSSPVPTTPSITEKESDFAPPVFTPTFDMQPTLLPASRNVPRQSPDRLRSDQFVPLELEWESVEDLSPPDR